MKNTIYSFQILSLLIILAFSNYSMAQEVSLKKQDIKTKERITSYFSGHLSGHADAYNNKRCGPHGKRRITNSQNKN